MKLRFLILTALVILTACGVPAETVAPRPTAVVVETAVVVLEPPSATPTTAVPTQPPVATPIVPPSPTNAPVVPTGQEPTSAPSAQVPTVTMPAATMPAPTATTLPSVDAPPPTTPAQPVDSKSIMPTPTATPLAASPTTQRSATPVRTSTPAPRTITLSQPHTGTKLTSGDLIVEGATNFWPFEATLLGRVTTANGKLLGQGPITVSGDQPANGQGSSAFHATIHFTMPVVETNAVVEVLDVSAKDGSVQASARVPVAVVGGVAAKSENSIVLDWPIASVAGEPLHIAFHGALAGETVTARLRFPEGAVVEGATVAFGGGGVINLTAGGRMGAATLELLHADGTAGASSVVAILGPAETQPIKVVWVAGEDVVLVTQRTARTGQIGAATLNELLWGPAQGSGYTSAIPSGVTLLSLTIKDGVAVANFSPELAAYAPAAAGSATRARLIRKQIEQTLLQFPAVKQVVIQIAGQSDGVLRP